MSAGLDWPAIHRRLEEGRHALERTFARIDGDRLDAEAEAILRERARRLAHPEDADAPDSRQPVLVFQGRADRFGLPLADVARVVPLEPITPIPGAAPGLLGIVAVAGVVHHLLDVDAVATGGPPGDPPGKAPAWGGHAVILRRPVRAALAVMRAEAIRALPVPPPPPPTGPPGGEVVRAVTEDRVLLLDADELLLRCQLWTSAP